MLNGGELPEGMGQEEDHKAQEIDDDGLGDLVGVDMDADPEVIQRQIEMIERATNKRDRN